MKRTSTILLTALALTASAVVSSAQEPANPPRPGGDRPAGERRGGDRGTPEEFRQRMTDRLKTSLKVSDEEWTVIQPLIEKVQTVQRESMGSRFGGFGGGRGGERGGDRGGDTATQDTRPAAAASTALRTALESETTSPDDIKAKLNTVRELRKKGAADLAAAREELKKVVTVRQEAVLVTMGILE